MLDADAQCIRRYLLGDLPLDECIALEKRYFSDDDFFIAVRATETELIRDYVVGELDSRESLLFDEQYLGRSALRRQDIEFTQFLLASLDYDVGVGLSGSLVDLLRAKNEDESLVTGAITAVLLPSLPQPLRSSPVHCPKMLFLAIDSVAMLVHRYCRGISTHEGELLFDIDNSIRVGRQVIIPADTLIGEIASVAKVPPSVATELVEWIRVAASNHPRLMLGLESRWVGNGMCALVVSKRILDEDLRTRWDLRAGGVAEMAEHPHDPVEIGS